MKLKYLFLILFLHFFTNVKSQKLILSIESGFSMSYTGFNFHTSLLHNYKNNEFNIGTHIFMSDTYLPTKGPFGTEVGYKNILLINKKFESFLGLNYQNQISKAYRSIKKNWIHEALFQIGIGYKINSQIKIRVSHGIGMYQESFYSNITQNRFNNTGINYQFKVTLKCKLKS